MLLKEKIAPRRPPPPPLSEAVTVCKPRSISAIPCSSRGYLLCLVAILVTTGTKRVHGALRGQTEPPLLPESQARFGATAPSLHCAPTAAPVAGSGRSAGGGLEPRAAHQAALAATRLKTPEEPRKTGAEGMGFEPTIHLWTSDFESAFYNAFAHVFMD